MEPPTTVSEFLKELESHLNDSLDPYPVHVDAAALPEWSPEKIRVMEVLVGMIRDEAHRYPELITFAAQLDSLLGDAPSP